jgi:hypothetical protein
MEMLMRLEELHRDADLLRRTSAAATPDHASGDDNGHDGVAANDASDPSGVGLAPIDGQAASADVLPLPPPPPPHARARSNWAARLAALAPRLKEAPFDAPLRQRNLAPWLALGVLAALALAVGAGWLQTQRVGAEAERTVEATERAVGLLGGAPTAMASTKEMQTGGVAPTPPPGPTSRPPVPAADRLPVAGPERHEAMLEAIRNGALLTALPPAALLQPSPLPAEGLPARAPLPRADAAASPPKKIALTVEGAAAAPRAVDPLSVASVSSALKGSPVPLHRVYQLRESDGEWLGYVARADDDPLATGVWAGSGDLLSGGWRVAEVNAQRLTLVGPRGALEILRP